MRSAAPLPPLDLSIPRGRGATAALHHQLREAILEGRLATGMALPSSRVLASSLMISRNTVTAVYEMLVAEGYAEASPGSATRVRSVRRRALAELPAAANAPRRPPLIYDLRMGRPDIASFPASVWQRLSARVLRQSFRDFADYGAAQGELRLRDAIAGHVANTRAVACTPDTVIVTTGAQQAYALLARVLMTRGQSAWAIEDPGYPALRATLLSHGIAPTPIPVDREGLVVDALPPKADIVFVTPSHQSPLGVVMSARRREQLARWAEQTGGVIVEDDYDGEFRYESRPLDALQTLLPDRVCYIGSFSKTLFPALRVGFLVAPPTLLAPLCNARQINDGFTAPLTQLTLATFIQEGHLGRHLRAMQKLYAERRTALVGGLARHLGQRFQPWPSSAGLHFSIRADHWEDLDRRIALLAQRGVAITSLSPNFVARDADALALSFGRLGAGDADLAAQRIAEALNARI